MRCGIPNWGDSAWTILFPHCSSLAPALGGAAAIFLHLLVATFVFTSHTSMFYICEMHVSYFPCCAHFTELPRLHSFSNQ